jgi:hypothetical protein
VNTRPGARLQLLHLLPNVENVIKVAKLGDLLGGGN